MSSAAPLTVHRSVVDGVTCFWVDSETPTMTGVLRFGYGYAHEPFEEAGWQHLIEHISLHGRDRGVLEINGSVDLLTTEYVATGLPEEVAAHFTDLTAWLADPDFADLDVERRVLRAESGGSDGGPIGRAHLVRWGATGPGLRPFDEPGLDRAEPQALRARIDRVFTRANAVMFFDGPIPDGLQLTLPAGERTPLPQLGPVEVVPTQYPDPTFVLSGVISARPAGSLAVEYLERALTQQLRHSDGATYEVHTRIDDLGNGQYVVGLGADLSTDALATVVPATLAWLQEQISDPTGIEAELAVLRERRRRELLSPGGAMAAASAAADRHLDGDGEPTLSIEELLDRLEAFTASDVQERLVEFGDTLLVGVPEEAEPAAGLPMLEPPRVETAPAGTRWLTHVNAPADPSRLGLSADALVTTDGETMLVWPISEIAAVLVHRADHDGHQHEQWRIVARNGYGYPFTFGAFAGDEAVRELLTARLPEHAFVPTEDELDDFEPVGALARRIGGWARWVGELGTGRFWTSMVVLALLGLAVGITVAETTGAAWLGYGVQALTVAFILASRVLRRLYRDQ